MVLFYDSIPDDPKFVEWILDQKLFHVASAPLNGGHVNVSPKGYQTFKLVNKKACWYLDLSGSGNETISHIYEPGNGRVTILFQAFEGPARLVRLYGKGKVFERGSPEYEKLLAPGGTPDDQYDWPTPEIRPGARAIIWLDIEQVGTSCGFSVPLMDFVGERDILDKWCDKLEKGDTTVEDPYTLDPERGFLSWLHNFNTWSVDGLPGLKSIRPASYETISSVMTKYGMTPPPKSKKPNSHGGLLGSRGLHSVQMVLLGVGIGVLSSHYLLREGPPLTRSLNAVFAGLTRLY
ncbi:hypothetical protein BC629DRAFT_1474848 [Irpex lacteus]|nr:hypothetical protein BC629DRAFT_1474848 [Irpex lacteus]